MTASPYDLLAFPSDADLTDDKLLRQLFMDAFPHMIKSFCDFLAADYGLDNPEYVNRVQRLLEYTCIGGKYNRGMLIVSGTKDLCVVKGLDIQEKLGASIILGWCVEILQACFLVADDVMDKSVTRRGKPCWYRLEDIQMDAVNDSLILESFIYYLLKKFCGHESWYLQLVELYHDISLRTQMGQMLDLMSQPQGKKGPEVLKNFSKVRLQQIVDYKTAYYTFYLPIVSAMVICGLDSAEQMRHAKEISVMLGRKFQTQDDFLDCFGDPQHIGKVGTDIQDHKCTWLLVNALDLASDDQRKIIEENLGKEDEDSVSKIKNLYKDLALDALFDQFETDSYDEISKAIDAASASIPTLLFSKILNKIHRRSY